MNLDRLGNEIRRLKDVAIPTPRPRTSKTPAMQNIDAGTSDAIRSCKGNATLGGQYGNDDRNYRPYIGG
jgi:hypothetical protein